MPPVCLFAPNLALAGYARVRLTIPPHEEYAAILTGQISIRDEDFIPNQEISVICWWDTTGSPHGNAAIIDASLAQLTRLQWEPLALVGWCSCAGR